MRCFKDGCTVDIIDIGSRSDTDTTDHCCERIRDIVAVEVEGSDDIIFCRAKEDLLEESICDDILDEQCSTIECCFLGGISGFLALCGDNPVILSPGKYLVAIFPFCEGISPFFKLTLCILHDIALVDDRHALAAFTEGMLEGSPDQALGTFYRYRLDPEGRSFREAYVLDSHFFDEETFNPFVFRASG